MTGSHVHAGLQVSHVDQRLLHAHRLEQVLAHVVGIALAGSLFDHQGGHREQDVVVGVVAAETVLQRHLGQPLDHFPGGVRGRRPVQQITRAQTQATAVRQQVANAHLVRHVRIGHAEPGQVVDHAVVHVQLARVGQLLQRRGSEGLGVGGDREQRVRVDRVRLAQLLHAEAALHHHLAVLDDGHRDAGHLEGLQRIRHVGVEILQLRRQQRLHDVAGRYRRRQLLRGRSLRQRRRAEHQQGMAGQQPERQRTHGPESLDHRSSPPGRRPAHYREKSPARPARHPTRRRPRKPRSCADRQAKRGSQ